MPKKQENGLYRAKVRIGVTPDGKEIVKYASAATIRELEQEKQKIRNTYIDGSGLDKARLFQDYVEEWFEHTKRKRLTPHTQYTYRLFLDKHILPAFHNRRMQAIRATDIQKWLNKYEGVSKSQINQLSMLIKEIFRAAYADGTIPRDPTVALVKPLSAKKEERRALTNDETTGVLKAIQGHKQGAFLGCLYYLGIRRGEALGLQWGDFDWDEEAVHIQRDIIYVRGKTTIGDLKTEAADRWVLLPKPLIAILKPMRGIHQAWVFSTEGEGNALCLTAVKRMWMSLMVDSGLAVKREQPKERKDKAHKELADDWTCEITPHYFRHNYITKLYYAGFDPVLAMWMVGHADYETTVNVYTHLKNQRLRKKMADMDWMYDLKKAASKLYQPDELVGR